MQNLKQPNPKEVPEEEKVAIDEMQQAAAILGQYITGFETYPSNKPGSTQTMYNLIFDNSQPTGNAKYPTVYDFADGMLDHGKKVKKSMSFISANRNGQKLMLNAISVNSREVAGDTTFFLVCAANEQKPISTLGQLIPGVNNYGDASRKAAEKRAEKAAVIAGIEGENGGANLSLTEWNFDTESGF
jgi:hypothetical protein